MPTLPAQLQDAAAALAKGQLPEAEALCRQLLAANPQDTEVLHLLAAVYYQRRELEKAEQTVRRAIAFEGRVVYYNTLGAILRAAQKPADAIMCYRRILAVSPDDVNALSNLANALGDLGDASEMLKILQRLRALGSADDARMTAAREGVRNSAVQHHRAGDHALADGLYAALLAEAPDSPEILALRALTLLHLGRPEQAEASSQRALELARRPDTLSARAQIHQANMEKAQAAALYGEALALAPDNKALLLPLASCLLDLSRFDDAHQAALAAHQATPGVASAVMLSAVYQSVGHLERAAEVLESVPQSGMLDAHLAASLSVFGQLGYIEKRAALTAGLTEALDAPSPLGGAIGLRLAFLTQFYGCSDEQKWKLLKRVSAAIDPAPRQRPAARARHGERLRVGYLSPNFGEHPTSHLLAPILEAHDRSRFAVHAYSTGDHRLADQTYPRRLAAATEFWRNSSGLSDSTLAAQIRADELDVLVDLGGYLGGGRPRALALRPAAVQMHWIMQLGGVAAPFFDYSIVDAVMVPGVVDEALHGALIHMPHSFQPGYVQPVAENLPSRTELGLPADGPVFCAFNNTLKIDSEVFAAWMEILRRVPRSVLWLSDKGGADGLRVAAALAEIYPGRLIFSPRIEDRAVHLARHRHCALYLDTFAFNGATSTMDALLAGLPPLTRLGTQAYGRIGASFLSVLGLPELICRDTRSYIEAAVMLGSENPRLLAALKRKVEQAVATRPLYDAALFTRQLEYAYDEAALHHAAGLKPQSFEVPPEGLVVREAAHEG